jgi:hypothetical protein
MWGALSDEKTGLSLARVPLINATDCRYIDAAWTPWRTQSVLLMTSSHRKHRFLYYCVLDRVYRAVAWQRIDQIHYNIYIYVYIYINLSPREENLGILPVIFWGHAVA